MKRPIKFRAWNGKKMVFGPRNEESNPSYVLALCAAIGAEPMQYTGLNDKRGRAIYEGDIVAITENSNGFCQVWAVEFFDGSFAVCNQLNSMRRIHSRFSDYSFDDEGRATSVAAFVMFGGGVETLCEVIGNIHQNPELLGAV